MERGQKHRKSLRGRQEAEEAEELEEFTPNEIAVSDKQIRNYFCLSRTQHSK